MSNKFIGRGNLGSDPELRHTPGDASEPVCSMRVYFDRPKPDGRDGFEDKGGFWLDVSYWGARGEAAARLLKKGARVAVIGDLYEDTWKDKDTGETRTKLRLRGDTVDLDLSRVENVQWRAKVAAVDYG